MKIETRDKLRNLARELFGKSNQGMRPKQDFAENTPQMVEPTVEAIMKFSDFMNETWLVEYLCISSKTHWPEDLGVWKTHLDNTRAELKQAHNEGLESEDEILELLETAMARFHALPENVRDELYDGPTGVETIRRMEEFLAKPT